MIYAEFDCTRSRGGMGFLLGSSNGALKLRGKSYASETGSGFICTHDMMEHCAEDEGKIENEFRALGSAPWIRGGIYRNLFSPESSLFHATGHDIGTTLESYCNLEKGIPPPPEFDANWTNEETIMWEQIWSAAEDNCHNIRVREKWLPCAMLWAKHGYRRAQERYPNRKAAIRVFIELQDFFETVLFNCKSGWSLLVAVDEQAGEFDSQLIFDEVPKGETEFEVRNESALMTISRYRHWKHQEDEARLLRNNDQVARTFEMSKVTFGKAAQVMTFADTDIDAMRCPVEEIIDKYYEMMKKQWKAGKKVFPDDADVFDANTFFNRAYRMTPNIQRIPKSEAKRLWQNWQPQRKAFEYLNYPVMKRMRHAH